MHLNLWQYLVLLEGLGAVGTAFGIAQEALRRDSLDLIGYANVGILLVCLSVVATIAANLGRPPGLSTWIGAAGFAVYALATICARAGLSFDRLRPVWHRNGVHRA